MLQAHIKDDFADLLHYRQWVNDQLPRWRINRHHQQEFSERTVNSMAADPLWFGSGVRYPELAAGITEYKSPELIRRIYDKVADKLDVTTTDTIKARRMNYNPFGLGVFSFDRAAMGMYRLKEFYSPSLDTVVDRQQVHTEKSKHYLKTDHSPVTERWEQKPDGQPKVRTIAKKVFAYYPKVSKEKQAVEIYLACGGHAAVKADEFLYSGMAAIVIAELLEKARVPTRITIAVGTSPDEYSRSAYVSLIPVKAYDEPLDSNLLALLSSDPRFYRFEGFKGVVSTYEHFRARCPGDLGTGITGGYLKKCIEGSSYTPTAPLAPNRFYFGRIFKERECIAAIETAIRQLGDILNP